MCVRILTLNVLLALFMTSAQPEVAAAQSAPQQTGPGNAEITPVVEMLNLWRTQSEQRALAIYRDALVAQGVRWYEEAATGNFATLQFELSNRLSKGVEPSVVQWIIGNNLRSLLDEGIFQKIPLKNPHLPDLLYPAVRDLVVYEDGLAAVPLGIHVQNYVVYNKTLMEKFGFETPNSWAQLLSYGPQLQAEGIGLIAWGAESWQVRQLLTSILVSLLEPADFDRLSSDAQDIADLKPMVTQAMEIFFELRRFNPMADVTTGWADVSASVMQGQSLGQILGDFQVPEMAPAGPIICGMPPETDYILWGTDTFAFINVTEPDLVAGLELLSDALFDLDNNRKYILAKGGIPVLKDIPPSALGPCSAESLRRWQNSGAHLFTASETWRKRVGVIGEFAVSPNIARDYTPEQATERLITLLLQI